MSAKKSENPFVDKDKDKTAQDQDGSDGDAKVGGDKKVAQKSRKVAKSDDDDDDEDDDDLENSETGGDDDDDDEDDDSEKSKKSVRKSEVSRSDLAKSIRKLRKYAEESDSATRKNALLQKAQGENLSKSEQAELFDLMSGKRQDERLGEKMTKSLEQDETIQSQLDVSDFLQAQHDGLIKSLRGLGEAVESQSNRQGEFNLLLAKAVADVGQNMRTLTSRLGALENQPARAPKSAGVGALNKSFGNRPAGEQLSKSQVLNALTDMNEASFRAGSNGLSKSGVDIATAVAKCEQTGEISPAMQRDLMEHLSGARGR